MYKKLFFYRFKFYCSLNLGSNLVAKNIIILFVNKNFFVLNIFVFSGLTFASLKPYPFFCDNTSLTYNYSNLFTKNIFLSDIFLNRNFFFISNFFIITFVNIIFNISFNIIS